MKYANSIVLNTDSYKVPMWKQYPLGTTHVLSYIESRGGRYDRTVFFGLQSLLREYLSKPVTMADVDFAEKIWTAHGELFNREGWEYIVNQRGGRLPITIRAVPEGTVVGTKNVLCVVENTDPKCFWLTTWVETALLRAVWYGTTVATQSWKIRQLITRFLVKTGDPSTIDFKLHDFGARGVSSLESAALGGAAHLINFMGTDTISGVLAAMEYYDADVCGFSIPAAEHSTVTSWGRENEVDAYRNMLKQFAKPGSIVAVVSDSYDIYNAAENLWGGELRKEVIESGATVVIRPDSGDPVEVNCKLIDILNAKFGSTLNSKGYRVLNHVRLIQGDGVNEVTIEAILSAFEKKGFSADNIAFGMGGALLQQLDRDTQKFAMKASAAKVNGEWRDVVKDPITDSGKKSKAGRVDLVKDRFTGAFRSTVEDWEPSALVEVFRDGVITKEYTFEEVRANAKNF